MQAPVTCCHPHPPPLPPHPHEEEPKPGTTCSRSHGPPRPPSLRNPANVRLRIPGDAPTPLPVSRQRTRTTPTCQPSPRPPARTLLHARARARQGRAPPPGRATPRRLTAASVEWSLQALKQACSQGYPESAICVQSLDDSLDSAIRITYRISLRSSSLREPRHPPLKVFWMIVLGCLSAPQPRALPRGRHAPQRVDSFVFKNRLQSVIKVGCQAPACSFQQRVHAACRRRPAPTVHRCGREIPRPPLRAAARGTRRAHAPRTPDRHAHSIGTARKTLAFQNVW